MSSVERVFPVNGYSLAANEFNRSGEKKVIALHGWLDNAASFDKLSVLLTNCHIIALDLSGHGLSDHKPQQATYNIWDDLLDILAVADELEWDKFTLLGHSRGAIISLILAASAPQRIESLILLDGILAPSVESKDTAKQLAQFLTSNRAAQKKKPPIYHSIQAAIDARCQASSMMPESARVIVERGLKPVDGGFTWKTDPRLMAASAVKMTIEHNRALLTSVAASTLLLLAEQGVGANPLLLNEIEKHNVIQHKLLPGNHHFHMEEPAEVIAGHIMQFMGDM